MRPNLRILFLDHTGWQGSDYARTVRETWPAPEIGFPLEPMPECLRGLKIKTRVVLFDAAEVLAVMESARVLSR